MIAIGIRYLNGWAMATDPADRERPEWPPHPDRVFMALAAAYFETGGDERQRDALTWLERQSPPDIVASGHEERTTQTVFVPVNDSAPPRIRSQRRATDVQVDAGVQLLPERRGKQPRQFPVAIPHDPTVYLVWNQDPDQEVRDGLESLCGKVVNVGHSASMVQVWVEDREFTPTHVRTPGIAERPLRVPGRGRLAHLEAQYRQGRRPERARWESYARRQPVPDPEVPVPVFDSRIVILKGVDRRRAGSESPSDRVEIDADDPGQRIRRRYGLESTLNLTEILRNSVVSRCPEPVPEWVSGHTPDGRPSQLPHLSFLPLPFVRHQYADGHLLGLGLAFPRGVAPREAARCLNPVLGYEADGTLRQVRLYNGPAFDWTLEMERDERPAVALRADTWTRPNRRWASVTPVAFDRHAKGKHIEAQQEEMVAVACERIGLPRPLDVVLTPVTLFEGVPHSREFPPIVRKSGGRLRHAHAILTFDQPVSGPIILGAGRYRGYGFFRPLGQSREE